MAMTTSDRLYQQMKQDITVCSLLPGSPISEAELCKRYRASRTPVREASRRLESEGLITIVPFRGYFIAPLTLSEFQNLQEVQLIVEPATAALAATRATPAQIKAIETAGKYEYRVGQKNSYFTFLQRNFELHVGIAEAAQNDHLVEVTTSIQTRLMRFFYLIIAMDAFGPELVNEHERLVSAIRARNALLASERAADHVRKTIERSARLLLNPVQGRTGCMRIDVELNAAALAEAWKADGKRGGKAPRRAGRKTKEEAASWNTDDLLATKWPQ
ncbi:MAG TPA: GntR family transcriptional regulator [Bryobacteraceae bacterium]|nr:GntR family transcriptional regulator [Bryobacteraceae bacterium]